MYHSSLERVGVKRDLEITWRAFELQPRELQLSPEEEAAREAYIAQAWPQVERMARDVYGLELRRGRSGVDTRTAHVGAQVAREAGLEGPYVVAVFRAYWEQGRDIGDRAVLREVAEGVGIPPDRFLEGLDDEGYLQRVMEEQAESRRLGIRGVPATVVNGRYLLSGCRPAADLERVLDRLAEARD